MNQPDRLHQLIGVFVSTAEAHHQATGGVNPAWAQWYAEKLVDEVNRITNAELTEPEMARWLTEADLRYQREDPPMSWPKAYAQWLLAEKGH